MLNIEPIGVIHSPYKEKFAVPRQANLVSSAKGELHLIAPFNQIETVRELMQFSHIWLLFIFHQTQQQGWHPTVRPPRLGGNKRIGVFATRSTFRPNPIGLSLVKLNGIKQQKSNVILELGGLDLIDQTPVIDIKPYLPFADSLPDARAGYAETVPTANLAVIFSPEVEKTVLQHQASYPELKQFISEVLAQDPRPAYHHQQQQQRNYAVRLYDFNIRWRVNNDVVEVFAIEMLK